MGNCLGPRQCADRSADSSARILYFSGGEAGACQRPFDCATRSQSGNGQNPLSEDVALSARLAEGSPRLAFSAAHGIPGCHHCHDHPDGMVHHVERAVGRTGEPKPDHESRESALVFSRPAGNAGVFRSVDSGRGYAYAHHYRADGDSVHRHQPVWLRLLHMEPAQVCYRNFSLWLCRLMGFHDRDWDFYSWTWLAMVLAGANLGP